MGNKILSPNVLAALLAILLHATTVQAEGIPAPQQIVSDAIERMLQSLKDNDAQLQKNPDHIFVLVEAIIMPHFDFAKIAKLALGKNWRKASPAQREQFTEQFRLLLIRTYATALLEYTDQQINLQPAKAGKNKKANVAMEIVRASGPAIPMVFSMYVNTEETWKVYDVKIDGISLVTNYRTSFASHIKNKGLDSLIEQLATKNEKVTT